jgi:hypothetical protein
LALFLAIGIRYTLPMLVPHLAKARNVVMVGLVLALSGFQTYYYFNIHLPTFNHQMRASNPHPDAQDAALRSMNFPPNTHVHLISEIASNEGYTQGFMSLLNDDIVIHSLRPRELTINYIDGLNPNVDHAFYIAAGHDNLLALLERYMVVLPPQHSPYDDIPDYQQFTLYYAPSLPGFSDVILQRLDKLRPRRFPLPVP